MMLPSSRLASILLILPLTQVSGWWWSKVCYGDLGCFRKFLNTNLFPRSPETIGTEFTLYTRNTTSIIDHQNLQDITEAKEIKVIVHGFLSSAATSWVQLMVQELLINGDYYVITVDYSNSAQGVGYLQAAADIRVVGAEVARLLKAAQAQAGISPGNVHIIGHSLGAQLAGYAGETLSGIGRITGMDPAGPAFEFWPVNVRLDQTDAQFVDVIHTDGDLIVGLGMMIPAGHLDFYPNGGKFQPGCPILNPIDVTIVLLNGNFGLLTDAVLCSHRRAYEYFIESINSGCQFTSYPCNTINDQSSVNCNTCGTGCALMGFHANAAMNAGKYFLQTNPTQPFCIA